MILRKFTKRPGDRKRYLLRYGEWLDTGETLVQVTFEVTPAGPGGMVVDASQIEAGGKDVVFFTNLGVDEQDYTVGVRATTSGGQIKNDQLVFSVRGD